eukprot:1147687-Pelagomonas_calceolata.AAC.2
MSLDSKSDRNGLPHNALTDLIWATVKSKLGQTSRKSTQWHCWHNQSCASQKQSPAFAGLNTVLCGVFTHACLTPPAALGYLDAPRRFYADEHPHDTKSRPAACLDCFMRLYIVHL